MFIHMFHMSTVTGLDSSQTNWLFPASFILLFSSIVIISWRRTKNSTPKEPQNNASPRYTLCQLRLIATDMVHPSTQIGASDVRHGIIDWEFTNLTQAKQIFQKVQLYDNHRHSTVLMDESMNPIMTSHGIDNFEMHKDSFVNHIMYKRSLEGHTEGWMCPAPGNAWNGMTMFEGTPLFEKTPGAYEPLQYTKNSDMITLRGLITLPWSQSDDVLWRTIAELPPSARPNKDKIVLVASGKITMPISIRSNGKITTRDVKGSEWISFDGVSFSL